MALGTPKSAAETYQQVISDGGDGLYAQMAKLGLAEAQAQTGEYDRPSTPSASCPSTRTASCRSTGC